MQAVYLLVPVMSCTILLGTGYSIHTSPLPVPFMGFWAPLLLGLASITHISPSWLLWVGLFFQAMLLASIAVVLLPFQIPCLSPTSGGT